MQIMSKISPSTTETKKKKNNIYTYIIFKGPVLQLIQRCKAVNDLTHSWRLIILNTKLHPITLKIAFS